MHGKMFFLSESPLCTSHVSWGFECHKGPHGDSQLIGGGFGTVCFGHQPFLRVLQTKRFVAT